MSLSNSFDTENLTNKILPGQRETLSSEKMTSYNELRRVLQLNPHLLPVVTRLFAQKYPSITAILANLKGGSAYYDESMGSYTDGYGSPFPSGSFIHLNQREYAWQVESPKGWVYKVLECSAPNAAGIVGAGGTEFTILVDKDFGREDDVIQTVGHKHNLKVVRFKSAGMNQRRLVVRAQNNTGVPYEFVKKGAELSRPLFNQKQEYSSTGSDVWMTYNGMRRGSINTVRHEFGLSGYAANMRLYNDKGEPTEEAKKYMSVYQIQTKDGKLHPVWMHNIHARMLEEHTMALDNAIMWAQRDLDADGNPRRDASGNQYLTGDGIYYQTNGRMKRPYRKLTADIFDDMLMHFYYENDGTRADLYILADGEFRKEADKIIRATFTKNALPLFFDGKGGFYTGDGKKQGVRSNFTLYETPLGRITIVECPYFDAKVHPRVFDTNGRALHRGRAFVVNLAGMEKGESPITLVSNRMQLIGEERGMANPAADGTISTAVDGMKRHILSEVGGACRRDNVLMELYKIS
jgi:hypothetical protein